MNPILVALKGKGLRNLVQRGANLVGRYGVTSQKMDRALAQFAAVLRQFGASATFPVTAITLQRNSSSIQKYPDIEFAVHGYRHIDHSLLSQSEQSEHLALAKQLFDQANVPMHGFRCPYLRYNSETLASLREQSFLYDSSQSLAWDVLDGPEPPDYRHVLDFYGARSASDFPSLPRIEQDLVRIPYSLPDDEALVERLDLRAPSQMNDLWLAILDRTYQLGELFTVGLHPERIGFCREPLLATLAQARSLTPAVWIARLDAIANWWKARTETVVEIVEVEPTRFHLQITGPQEITLLVRGVGVSVPSVPWANGYRQVNATELTVRSSLCPFIGLSPDASPELARFLRQQGYIVQIDSEQERYAHYVDWREFSIQHERRLLAQIDKTDRPLVRLGRWPSGARSALAVTGDIDCLTLWDYILRLWERPA